MFLNPKKGEGLENTKSTAGTNGIRNHMYSFSGKKIVPESKISKKKEIMQGFRQKSFLGESGFDLQGLFQTIAEVRKIFRAEKKCFSSQIKESFAPLREKFISRKGAKVLLNFGYA